MKIPRNSQLGFTRVELAATVGMSCLLGALAFAGIDRAKAKSQRMACTTNLKNIGLAWREYAMDAEPRGAAGATHSAPEAPPTSASDLARRWGHAWLSPKTWVCPANSRPAAAGWQEFNDDHMSYFAAYREGAVASPAMPTAGDCDLRLNGAAVPRGALHTTPSTVLQFAPGPHGEYRNIALGDGSVQGVKDLAIREAGVDLFVP